MALETRISAEYSRRRQGKQLKEVGWTKGVELAKLARRDRQHFDCATWLHKARQMPKEDFKKEVERELTGRETEPWEILYFKLYQSQMPVIEKALETAALMMGSDREDRAPGRAAFRFCDYCVREKSAR